jgi:hypothetical protein
MRGPNYHFSVYYPNSNGNELILIKYLKEKFKFMAKNNHALKINSERGFQFDMKKKKVYFIKT